VFTPIFRNRKYPLYENNKKRRARHTKNYGYWPIDSTYRGGLHTHTHADAPLPWFDLRHCTYRNNRTNQSIDSASTLLRPWCQDKPWQILNFDRFLQRRNAARKWNTKSKNALPTLSRPTALIVCFRFTIWTGNDKTAEVIQITRQWIHGLWLKPPHIPDND